MDKETLAAELRAEVGRIAFDVSAQLTRLNGLIQSLEALGARTLAIKSHNMDVANAGGLLSNVIPEDLRAALNKLRLAYKSLEDYKNVP